MTASKTEYPNNLPEKVVDGNESTRWADASYKKYAGYEIVPDLNWIAVDLGKVCSITKPHLKWEGAYQTNAQQGSSSCKFEWM